MPAGRKTAVAAPPERDLWSRRKDVVPRGLGHGTPLVVSKASGARVWDTAGREYVDFIAGLGAMNVGHGHPVVNEAVSRQLERFTHVSIHVGLYEPYVSLAERLVAITPGRHPKKAIFFNSGAEAVENAIKIARAATGRPAVLTFSGAFHGRTLLGMSLTAKAHPIRNGFGPFAPGIYRLPFPHPYRPPLGSGAEDCGDRCLEHIRELLLTEIAPSEVAALIVEPVQGEGGIVVPPAGFLEGLQDICAAHGIMFILDEVATGFGRTGTMFAAEKEQLNPDMIVLGKGLAAGHPLSAVVGKADVMDAPVPGALGSTYGGNPLACAAAHGVLDVFEQEPLTERAQVIGGTLRSWLAEALNDHPHVGDVRGSGAMLGIEMVIDRDTKEPAPALAQRAIAEALDEGLLVFPGGSYGNVIRLMPPLVASDDDVEQGIARLGRALSKVRA